MGDDTKQDLLAPFSTLVQITLNAVLVTVDQGEPKILCTRLPASFHDQDHHKPATLLSALPYGPFDPIRHRTFEIGLRDWVAQQTKVNLGYVEQLYTFGDRDRERLARPLPQTTSDANAPSSTKEPIANHILSVGYLALAPEPARVDVAEAQWVSWYRFFPWEDWRNGEPAILSHILYPALDKWAHCQDKTIEKERRTRIETAFGLNQKGWEEERILERFELMHAAGLTHEAQSQQGGDFTQKAPIDNPALGQIMVSDHRRILATAIGRLRGKLKYRPVIFELMPAEFTLLTLQKTVEALIGFPMHKQNFRRSVESAGLVRKTGKASQKAGGRPAALFETDISITRDHATAGLVIPRLKSQPKIRFGAN